MTQPVRVLLVDDDPLVRAGLKLMLNPAPDIEVVGEAGDGDEVVAAVRTGAPDVVLMDLRLPRIDGIEATRLVRALPQPPRVIALTTWDVDDALVKALDAGADGFLLKSASPQEIVDAVRAVMRGDAMLSPRSTKQLLNHLAHRPTDDAASRRAVRALTQREREVAVEVAGGLTNAEIAARLFVSETTVKTHVNSALTKLDLTGRVQLAVLIERAGLLRP